MCALLLLQRDQGHGIILHNPEDGYQQLITFGSGSRQVSLSVEVVSLYILGSEPTLEIIKRKRLYDD